MLKKCILAFTIIATVSCGFFLRDKEAVYIPVEGEDPIPVPIPPIPPDSCENGEAVSFNSDITPIVETNCISCHPGYLEQEFLISIFDDVIKRVSLPFNDPKRMPLSPRDLLDFSDIQKFKQYKLDGFQEDSNCRDDLTEVLFRVKSLDDIEKSIMIDLNNLNDDQKANARYLVLSHKFNNGAKALSLKLFTASINKSINSLSSSDRIIPPSQIDSEGTIFRLFLDDYNLGTADWNLIIENDKFNFISNTSLGKQIKELTKVEQPWLHADNFINITLGIPNVYATLLKIPLLLEGLIVELDVNLQQQSDDFLLRLIGFNSSPISLQKNRMLIRSQNRTGDKYLWITQDTNSQLAADKNLFQFPLLDFIDGAQAIFNFDASEAIWSLNNGLQGYALFDNNGNLALEAPVDIVQNIESPFSPTITLGIDCFRCHSKGLIPADDQIKEHVNENASNFNRNDVEIVDAFYKSNITNRALFQADIGNYSKAATLVGDDLQFDPINALVDELRSDLDINHVASFVFMSVKQFRKELNKSSALKAQIGQLLTNNKISFFQLLESFPLMIEELRLGEEKIDD